jgi:hypothetical protein
MIIQYEIDVLKCKYDHVLRSMEYTDEQVDNFIDYVLPSLARRNANMKQKKIQPSALDVNYDKYSCGFPVCGGQLFSTKQKYVQHLNAKHRAQLPDGCRFLAPNDKTLNIVNLQCKGCSKVYSRIDKFESHLRSNGFCALQVARACAAEERHNATQKVQEQLEQEENENDEESEAEDQDEQTGEQGDEKLEATDKDNEKSDKPKAETELQELIEREAEQQALFEAEIENDEISQQEETPEEAIDKILEKTEQQEQQDEFDDLEDLDYDELVLLNMMTSFKQPTREVGKSKRTQITPSSSLEQIAKKSTRDF